MRVSNPNPAVTPHFEDVPTSGEIRHEVRDRRPRKVNQAAFSSNPSETPVNLILGRCLVWPLECCLYLSVGIHVSQWRLRTAALSALSYICGSLCLLAQPALLSRSSAAPRSDAVGVFERLTIARFMGSGQDSIAAMTTDRDGNLYIAGSTTSPDLPMKNAAQSQFGGSAVVRSRDGGARQTPFSCTSSSHVSIMSRNCLDMAVWRRRSPFVVCALSDQT
jgi:Beta-propeller repeat